MGMDTGSSDHDIFLKFKDGKEDMVQILYEVLVDLQKQPTTHLRLKRADIICKDFAVEIQNYYRSRDFDLVPYTVKPDVGECQWDPVRKVWQPILHKDVAPKLQELSQEHPDGFSMTRLLKIWNESLPPLRESSGKKKVPLISVHIPLMVLGALDQQKLDHCSNPQSYVLESLKFIKDNWSRGEVAERERLLSEIGAEVHLQRMTKKYREAHMAVEFAQLLERHLAIIQKLCQEEGNDRATADRVIERVRELFDSDALLAPEPAHRCKVRSEHLVSAVDLVLEQFQSDLARIQSSLYKKMALQQQRLSYEEVLGPVEILLDRVEKVWGAINFLRRAWRISPKIDEIYHQLSYRLSTAASILAQSDFLHEALRQLSEQDLSPVQRRVVMRLAREGFTMGVGIEDPETLRSLEGTKRLAQLATVFSQNVAQDEEQVLLRASRDEIKGLSQKVLDVLNSSDGEEFRLTSQREACEAYGRDAENADLRRQAFLAARRLGSGNLPVIAEMLRIRQDWAAVLGYRNFADLAFEARSGSKAEVEMLLQALRESSEAAAVEELKVCFLTSGEKLTVLEDDLQGQTAKAVKKALAAEVSISRFKQRCFVEDGSREIKDDEVLDPAPLKIQLVVLEFWPPDDEETEKMISASRDNDLAALEELLQHPRNPNVANRDGKTPMFRAAEQGHVQIMELLLEAGAKTDEPEFARGRTPLFAAARNDHLNAVRFLAENGAAKDLKDINGSTPLWVAARNGHLDVVQFLAEAGAAKDQTANNGATPLWIAAKNGHLDIVRFLVEHGAAKDQASNFGSTPLLLAAQNGHLDIVRFLVEVGSNMNQGDVRGETPLLRAAEHGHLDIVRFLVEVGSAQDQGPNFGATPLSLAAQNGPPRHCAVSSRKWIGATPLLLAAQNGHLDIVRFLVENGAAKDRKDINGATALLWTAQNGHLDIVRFLVENGAAKDQTDISVATPLLRAAQNGHLDIVRFLVEHGAAKDQTDITNGAAKDQASRIGATPLLLAAQNGHLDIVRFLVENGAAKDRKDINGATALLWAVQNGHIEIERFLVENGAARDQADRNGATPLLVASQDGHLDIDLKTFADGDLRVWDIDHVRSKMKQSEFEEAQLEPYLPLTAVIRGLFNLIERLFGVRLEKATSRREVPLWHRSIRFYRLVDVDSQHPIAGLYLDLFQHGKKLRSGGFWSASRALVHLCDFIWQRIVADFSREQDFPRFTMLLHRVVLLWPLMMSSATENSESLSPLAKNIIATLSSSGNAVMRRDFGHERPREDLDSWHDYVDVEEEESTSEPGLDTSVEPLEEEETTTEILETTVEETTGSTTRTG
eukprot:s2474_g4.t1